MTKRENKVIPLSELKKHNTRGDCWVALNGKVYDITGFIDEHPGGEEVLMDLAGKDCTLEFGDVGHSEYAVEALDALYVGDGDPSELIICDFPLVVPGFGTSSSFSSE